MNRIHIFRALAVLVVAVAALALFVPRSNAYVEAPHSLGAVVAQSTNILVCVVEKVDKEKNLIIFRKTEDLKGKHPTDVIRHNIARAGFHPREWQTIMEWAEVGKTCIFFHNGGSGEMCLGMYWYQIYPGGEWWNMSHGEPFLLRSFAGKAEKLIPIVREMVAGRETVAPCMVDGNKDDLHLRRAKIQRLKVSLKLQDYNPKRDFAGWGGEDVRVLRGLPGFTHYAALNRVDPEAQAVSVADFDGDGKPDLCLVGAGKVVLLQNGGDAYSEVSLPGVTGCRAAVWADYNADGKPDLLLATNAGPKLFTNMGGNFRDDSRLLPTEANWNLTSAAWLDHDGDGKPDILLANGYLGLRLYRNNPPKDLAQKLTPPKFGEWNVIGPFDSSGRRGFDMAYPPEKEIDLTKEYAGKADEKIKWRKHNVPDGAVHQLAQLFKNPNESCCYLYREIDCGTETELPVSFGSDDTLSVWINGERIIHENVDRAAGADQNLAVLKLKPGVNKLLLKICNAFGEWAFYFKPGEPKIHATGWFVDVSTQVGLGPTGLCGSGKGDTLSVADVNGDGRPDFLYGAGTGCLAISTPQGFVEAKDSGIAYKAGKVGPVFVDVDQDGHADLFVPQETGCKLFRNDGRGKFSDITASCGDLGKPMGQAVSAAWGDFDNDGKLDVFIGCLRGPNRFLRNKGDGTFVDMSEEVGLTQKRFNTQAIALVDMNHDGALDAVFVNEGQESSLLLGSTAFTSASTRRAAITVQPGKGVPVGSKAKVKGADGSMLGVQEISGGDGRGGQIPPTARFALAPGKYKVEVRDSAGQVREKDITVAELPMRIVIGD